MSMLARLRSWAATIAGLLGALLEHWFGETLAVALMSVVTVLTVGVLWARVSALITVPRQNCTKAYLVDQRLTDYINLMAPLSPIVTANAITTTNATFLAALSKLPHQTSGNATSFSNANFTALANAVNNLQSNLQADNFES